MHAWYYDAVFYHIYPIGFCAAPQHNDRSSAPLDRLGYVYDWIEHFKSLGINALYLGPVFESTSHGYDTIDYYSVDRRLGSTDTLRNLCNSLNNNGIRVVFDAVFNHVGRDFWAFRDVLEKGSESQYVSWFKNMSFQGKSPMNDPFSYEGWNGHYNLVKLNLSNPDVRSHIFDAVRFWIREFNISGLRLDAADCIEMEFLRELSSLCKSIKSDFFLVGEVIHGDYRHWIEGGQLDSVTNYECYKGLYSSHNDRNYFEIAYSLKRQFDRQAGMYRNIPLYSFADNHDVNRVASCLKEERHLYTLYCLLFTMPGIPSIYYGSEWGIEGVKNNGSDLPLRPHLDISELYRGPLRNDLRKTISRLSHLRQNSKALKYGDYEQLHVNHEQLAFIRRKDDQSAVVIVNSSAVEANISFDVPGIKNAVMSDLLNPGESFSVHNGRIENIKLYPGWGRVLSIGE